MTCNPVLGESLEARVKNTVKAANKNYLSTYRTGNIGKRFKSKALKALAV